MRVNRLAVAVAVLIMGTGLLSACTQSRQNAYQQLPPSTTSGLTPDVPAEQAGASNGVQRNTYGGGNMGQYEGTNEKSQSSTNPDTPAEGGRSAP